MEQYKVTGMSCAACQARVEKAVSGVEGVTSCAVSLLTNSMGVEGSASPEAVIRAVTEAGYGAELKKASSNRGQSRSGSSYEDALKDTETPKMKKRLIASLCLLIPLMYVSMGFTMWGWPVPSFLGSNPMAVGIYELLLSGIIMVINQRFFISGFRGLIHRAPNMDTLVALGAGASFCYSIYALFAMTAQAAAGDMTAASAYIHEFYFESAGMILTLITVGKMLEARSKGKTTDALKALMKLAPKTAVLLEDGVERTVGIEEVEVGDLFVVRAGESIPVDGVIREGNAAINESALTGESLPADKAAGDSVYAATINTSGYMVCEAKKVGDDTALAGIIQLVSDAAATKAPIAKVADKVSGVFVPAVISVAVVTFIVWMLLGREFGYALARAISVLVISCPCALGLATPVAIMVGSGMGARSGILFKTALSLEQTGKAKIVALDKTGTLTTGVMSVTDIIPADGVSKEELLKNACALEAKSEHPIGRAIYAGGLENGVETAAAEDFEVLPGRGLRAKVDGHEIRGGNPSYIEEASCLTGNVSERIKTLAGEGKTPVLFTSDGRLLGMIAVADTLKADSAEAVRAFRNMGLHVVMMTGDNPITAAAIARKAGVDETAASVRPDGKEALIRKLQEHGSVIMIGDGINDAPALTRADVGIAIGAGTDIAIDAADVVLMKSSLMDAAAAVRISRATLRNIHENLFWAFFYNVLCIPLAAGCYTALLGWSLNPMFGAAAMSLSSFCVVSNALRLNLLKTHDGSRDRRIKDAVTGSILDDGSRQQDNDGAAADKKAADSRSAADGISAIDDDKAADGNIVNDGNTEKSGSDKEDKNMQISVKGMMCPHCEAHVKEALEKISAVKEAKADHEQNLVTLTLTGEVSEDELKAAVEGAGYNYCGII